jgi:tetratricopeptide (TPR) repeat protein
VCLTVTLGRADYVEARAEAAGLARKRKHAQALEAFTQLAASEDISEFQKSDALEQAAAHARTMRNYELAAELAEQIPLEAVSRSVQIRNLAAQHRYGEIVETYKDEKLETWPEYAAVHAYQARGRAFLETGDPQAAERDLGIAARIITHDTSEAAAYLWAMIARNREENLKDDEKALAAHRRAIEILRKKPGGAGRLLAGLGAADYLRRRGMLDEALAALELMNPHDHRGSWHGRILCALGATLEQAGRKQEALAAYKEILTDDAVHPSSRETAEKAIGRLNAPTE